MPTKKRYVVLGSSAAGLSVITKLVQLAPEDEIICISAASEPPYNTCLLVDYLSGDKKEAEVTTKPLSFFQEHGVNLKLGTKVVKLLQHEQKLQLDDGSTLPYDSLFIGTGTSPYLPPLKGIGLYQGIFSFHTLSDVKNILRYLEEHAIQQVTIIGAGLSGVECADALVIKGLQVTIIERTSQLLPSHADAQAAEILEAQMQKNGVTILKDITVEEIMGDTHRITSLLCSDGSIIPTEALIVVVGNRPNNSFLQGTDITLQHGRIVVDEHMMTTLPGVYAGGDITIVKNIVDDSSIATTRWSDAVTQGVHAAHSMVGLIKPYPGIALYTSSSFFNLRFAVGGYALQSCDNDIIFIETQSNFYQKLIFRKDIFVGFLLLGQSDKIGTLRQMLIKKAHIEEVMQYA